MPPAPSAAPHRTCAPNSSLALHEMQQAGECSAGAELCCMAAEKMGESSHQGCLQQVTDSNLRCVSIMGTLWDRGNWSEEEVAWRRSPQGRTGA